MKKIYKKELEAANIILELPLFSEILVAQEQDGSTFIWYEFDEAFEQQLSKVEFYIQITGFGIERSDNSKYLNSVFFKNGFVAHVYYERKLKE